jgi:hypothetical protein
MDVFEAVFLMYVLLCTVLLPLWMLLKRQRPKLSLVLVLIPILLGYLLYGYLFGSSSDEDHGVAVAGLFLTLPLLSFLIQLMAISIGNVVNRMKENRQ